MTSNTSTTTNKKSTVGAYLVERLYQIGVKHLFGVPGDFVIPFLEKVIENKDKLEYVGTCNELNAAYAADGYARINGVGALATTYVVGEFSALNGVTGSFAEKVPVINITGCPPTAAFNEQWMLHHTFGDYYTPMKVFKNVTAAHTMLFDSERAASEIDRILRHCLLKKLPVYIGIPMDIVTAECVFPSTPLFSSPLMKDVMLTNEVICNFIEKEFQKDQDSLNEAVAEAVVMIENSKSPIFIAGVELKRYRLEKCLDNLLRKTGIPYATMMLGKAVLDEDHPQFIGLYEGKTSRPYVKERVENSDCVIILGEWMTDLNTGGFSTQFNSAKLIKASVDKVQISFHYFRDIFLKNFMEKLASQLHRRGKAELKDLNIKPAIEGCTHRRTLEFKPNLDKPLCIARTFDRISHFLKEDSIVLADIGTSLYSVAETMLPKGSTFIGQTFYGSIGYTVGATLGAAKAALASAKPTRPVVLFIGDGAFQMTCQDLSTIIRNELKVIIFLINNDGYTIERLITDNVYNDIQGWQYHKLSHVFGGKDETFNCFTESDLESALHKISNNKFNLAFIEIHTGKMDASTSLITAGKYMARR